MRVFLKQQMRSAGHPWLGKSRCRTWLQRHVYKTPDANLCFAFFSTVLGNHHHQTSLFKYGNDECFFLPLNLVKIPCRTQENACKMHCESQMRCGGKKTELSFLALAGHCGASVCWKLHTWPFAVSKSYWANAISSGCKSNCIQTLFLKGRYRIWKSALSVESLSHSSSKHSYKYLDIGAWRVAVGSANWWVMLVRRVPLDR